MGLGRGGIYTEVFSGDGALLGWQLSNSSEIISLNCAFNLLVGDGFKTI